MNKPRYRYRWAAGVWKLMNEEQVSSYWPFWLAPYRVSFS